MRMSKASVQTILIILTYNMPVAILINGKLFLFRTLGKSVILYKKLWVASLKATRLKGHVGVAVGS